MQQDRTTRGIIAGTAGVLVQNIYTYILKIFGITNIVYLDVSKAVLFGNKFNGILADIAALLGHVVIDSLLGVVLAFYIQATSSRYFILKGVIFGLGVWVFIKVIGTNILRLPLFINENPATYLVFFVGAIFFGLAASLTLKALGTKTE